MPCKLLTTTWLNTFPQISQYPYKIRSLHTNAISLLLDFGPSFVGVFGAETGRDGNTLVRESDPRADAAATVERLDVTVATLARRLSEQQTICTMMSE